MKRAPMIRAKGVETPALSPRLAEIDAARINNYWARLGVAANARAVLARYRDEDGHERGRYVVVSDLVDGLPPAVAAPHPAVKAAKR